MSYDIYLRSPQCDKCGQYRSEPELPEPTYNLTPIFDFVLTGEPLPNEDVSEGAVVLLGAETDRPRGLRLLSGRTARETGVEIGRAVDRLNDPKLRDQLVDLEPQNKWGTVDDAREVMTKLFVAALEYPDHTWEIR
jgi:hypothetical protein